MGIIDKLSQISQEKTKILKKTMDELAEFSQEKTKVLKETMDELAEFSQEKTKVLKGTMDGLGQFTQEKTEVLKGSLHELAEFSQKKTQELVESASETFNEFTKDKSLKFMESVITGCALVAAADNKIDDAEIQNMIRLLNGWDKFDKFNDEEIFNSFGQAIQHLNADKEEGKEKAINKVKFIKNSPKDARIFIRICCRIGSIGGSFDYAEKNIVREMCIALGLEPSDFSDLGL